MENNKDRTAQIEGGTPLEIILQMTDLIQKDPKLNNFTQVQSMLTSLMQQDTKYKLSEIAAIVEHIQEQRALRHFKRDANKPEELYEESGYALMNDFMEVLDFINKDKALRKELVEDPNYLIMIAMILLTSGSVYIHRGVELVLNVERLAKDSLGRPVISERQKNALKKQFEHMLNLLV